MIKLLVVGALHNDVVVRASRLPQLDETLRGQEVVYQFGGKGGNQALAARKAGASVGFAGRIGDDVAGASMRATLRAAGVDVGQLQQGDGASGMSVAIVNEKGDYGAVIVSAENHLFATSALNIPAGCEMLLLQNEMDCDVLPACVEAAHKRGVRVVWNVAPAERVKPSDLALVDTLIVNKLEAGQILGSDDIASMPAKAVAALTKLAPAAEVIMTLGGDGVAFAAPGISFQQQSTVPTDVYSTHGAGDAFVGTFAACRLRRVSLAKAISIGQKAAATHISQRR
ncbi:PfkB family carbohydrate kinase [Pseudopelagicola sp. nBUS_19]|uniref:PfkB family carbohydrate kinase n=1 Tax=unclassified Pseudopelagicola TaxID=2649563 RepID=UPI003EC102FE